MNDYLSLRFDPLNIDVVGENQEEVLRDFRDELEFAVRNYALADDSELTQDAIELKRRAQRYLEEGECMAVLAQNIRVPFKMDAKKTEEFFRQADRTAYTRAVERAMAHKSGNSRP
nr:MAG TPA: hypothetical protein [Caudoviricetes sp.]